MCGVDHWATEEWYYHGFWKYTVDHLRAEREKHGIDTTKYKHCSSTVTVSKCATSIGLVLGV